MGGITIYRFVTLCAAAGALIVPAPGRAQTYIDQCNEQGKRFSIEARIDGCTATIKSGKSSGKDLAAAYGNRGHAYTDKKDYDRAIADFNEAIKLAPKFASAFTNRCFTRMLVGRELSQALADCNESLRLQS